MNLLDKLKVKSEKLKELKAKEPIKSKEKVESNRPLPKILDFFQTRQESRLGVLLALRTNQVVEETKTEPVKELKSEVLPYVS